MWLHGSTVTQTNMVERLPGVNEKERERGCSRFIRESELQQLNTLFLVVYGPNKCTIIEKLLTFYYIYTIKR